MEMLRILQPYTTVNKFNLEHKLDKPPCVCIQGYLILLREMGRGREISLWVHRVCFEST